jgi:hypothetical protein
MSFGDTFGYFSYQSDDGNSYTVKMSAAIASQGGYSATTAPIAGGQPVWPYHAHDMRHVTGKFGTSRARCPIASASNGKYMAGGTFTLNAIVYVITGAEGERRVASHVA